MTDSKFSSDDSLIPPPLYKYLSLAPDQTPHWTDRLSSLLNGEAYFPSPVDFNDPFDCLPHFGVPETKEEIEANFSGLVSQMQRSMTGMTPEEVELRMSRWLKDTDVPNILETVRASTRKSAEEMGVFCLSEQLSDILMWSHYAWNHKGIAVLFDLDRQPRSGLMPLFKVHYQKDRPKVHNLLRGLGDEQITNALQTKADFWAYEREWRAFKPRGARTIVYFDPAVIRAIALGVNCTPTDRNQVLELIEGRDINLGQMLTREDTFDLKINPIIGSCA
jgi:hypothetical protein